MLASVTSLYSRRNYAKALDLLFAFAAGRPLTRALPGVHGRARSFNSQRVSGGHSQTGHLGQEERGALE